MPLGIDRTRKGCNDRAEPNRLIRCRSPCATITKLSAVRSLTKFTLALCSEPSGTAMGIRETLNENPALVTRATIAIISMAVIFVIWEAWPTGQRVNVPREFFSDDDGATWFADSSARLAPFDHDGKEAVLAKVFRCHNGTRFVGYLEKFSEEAKKRIVEARSTGHMKAGVGAIEQGVPNADILVKPPHGGKWVPTQTPEAIKVQSFTCPDGSTDYEPVLP